MMGRAGIYADRFLWSGISNPKYSEDLMRSHRKSPSPCPLPASGARGSRRHPSLRSGRQERGWVLRGGVGVHARHLLLAVGFRIAAGDRPRDQPGDTGSGLGRLRVDLRQPVGAELGDVEETVLAGVDRHGPRREVVLVELFAELHGFEARDPARLVERVVVVEREIVLLLLVDRDPELLRGPHHGRVAVGHEIEQLDGVDVLLVVEEELPGLLRLSTGLAWKAVEGHDVVPDADLGGFA